MEGPVAAALPAARRRAIRFLVERQSADGAWIPSGSGTSSTLRSSTRSTAPAGCSARRPRGPRTPTRRPGIAPWAAAPPGSAPPRGDGGFGGGPGLAPSVEETGLALEALVDLVEAGRGEDGDLERIERAARWLVERTDGGRSFPRTPIGLYFAQLWYHEELYPVVFTVSALGAARRLLGRAADR